jgi:hypothetical protein
MLVFSIGPQWTHDILGFLSIALWSLDRASRSALAARHGSRGTPAIEPRCWLLEPLIAEKPGYDAMRAR